MKKVLYISRSFVDNSPVGIRHLNFRKYLAGNVELTTINLTDQSFLYYSKNNIYKIFNRFIKKLPLLPDTDILILDRYKKAIQKKIIETNFDTVIIGILPASFLSLAQYIKNINNEINVVLDMSDPITAHISFDSLSKFKKKFLLAYEEKYLKFVDTLVVLNEELKEYYQNKYNISNVIVIEQGLTHDFADVKKIERTSGPINFIYAGHLYERGREPYELYKAVEQLSYNVKLNIFGQFKKCFSPPKNEKFYYGGRMTQSDLKIKYNESDIIVFIDNKDSLQVPGKTLEILALNKPVLFIYFNETSPTLKYVNKYEGIFKTKNTAKEIKAAIEKIISLKCFVFERDLSNFYWPILVKRLIRKI